MDLRETDCGAVDWIHLVKDRVQWWPLLNMVINLWVP
jgi:hypothetical protein